TDSLHTCPPAASPHLTLPSIPTRRSSDLRSVRPRPCPASARPRRGCRRRGRCHGRCAPARAWARRAPPPAACPPPPPAAGRRPRSEEHTSELQSRENLVCRLLLEKKKTYN